MEGDLLEESSAIRTKNLSMKIFGGNTKVLEKGDNGSQQKGMKTYVN